VLSRQCLFVLTMAMKFLSLDYYTVVHCGLLKLFENFIGVQFFEPQCIFAVSTLLYRCTTTVHRQREKKRILHREYIQSTCVYTMNLPSVMLGEAYSGRG